MAMVVVEGYGVMLRGVSYDFYGKIVSNLELVINRVRSIKTNH